MYDIDIIMWVVPAGISFILTFLYIGFKIRAKNVLLLKRIKDYTYSDSSNKKDPIKKREYIYKNK